MPKPPTTGSGGGPTTGNGGNPGNGIGRFFTKAMYHFEHTVRAVSAGSTVLPPSDPRANVNDLTASATAPSHRRSYDPRIGGYYRFTASSSQYFTLAQDVTDAQSEVFFSALVRRRDSGTTGNIIMSRGDSMYMYMDATQLQFNVFTTSGGVSARVINVPITLRAGKWYLVHGAYKSGSYVRVGIDGLWLGETTFTATGLRNNAAGFSIGRDIGPSYSNHDIAFVGIATAIPTNRQMKQIAATLLSGADVPGGTNDPPGGGGGGTPPPDPGTLPMGSGLLLRGVG